MSSAKRPPSDDSVTVGLDELAEEMRRGAALARASAEAARAAQYGTENHEECGVMFLFTASDGTGRPMVGRCVLPRGHVTRAGAPSAHSDR